MYMLEIHLVFGPVVSCHGGVAAVSELSTREVRVMPIRFIFVPEDSVWMLKSVRGPKNVEK